MEKQYYIALQLIGINNEIIINIMKSLTQKELRELFSTEDIMKYEYKYNLGILKYSEILNNNKLKQEKLDCAKKIVEKNKKLNIRTVLYIDNLYPDSLKEISNAPSIIYIKGKNILKSDFKSIACVGSRNPTISGIDATKSLVSNLAKEKFTIISGLAYGVDKISHETCLNENGKTIAVLAHGLDMIYPKEHESLAKKILENGGTLISEYPVETKPDKFRFVDRNRIVSGLSMGLLMIEAKEKSGTNHTVNFAEQQGKKVFFTTYAKETLENGLNFKLLRLNKYIAINLKSDYHIIINELGYKLKYDNSLIEKLKNKALEKLMIPLKNNNREINVKEQIDAKTGFGVNKEIYSKFKNILKEDNLSVKEFFNAIIISIVKDYEGEDKK